MGCQLYGLGHLVLGTDGTSSDIVSIDARLVHLGLGKELHLLNFLVAFMKVCQGAV